MNVKLSKTPPFTNPPNVMGKLQRQSPHKKTKNDNILNLFCTIVLKMWRLITTIKIGAS
jgi:hypothetical protein